LQATGKNIAVPSIHDGQNNRETANQNQKKLLLFLKQRKSAVKDQKTDLRLS